MRYLCCYHLNKWLKGYIFIIYLIYLLNFLSFIIIYFILFCYNFFYCCVFRNLCLAFKSQKSMSESEGFQLTLQSLVLCVLPLLSNNSLFVGLFMLVLGVGVIQKNSYYFCITAINNNNIIIGCKIAELWQQASILSQHFKSILYHENFLIKEDVGIYKPTPFPALKI